MQFSKLILLSLLLLLFYPSAGQDAIAVSSNPGPGFHIALNWPPDTNAVAYSIFRKNETDAAYPSTPINALPVRPAPNCFVIRNLLIVSPDSADWKIVRDALADTLPFDPCQMNNLAKSSARYKRLVMIARANMAIARAAGLGYKDNTITNGKVYMYKIVSLDAGGNTIRTIATDLRVTAGSFTALPAPTLVNAEPGDASILVLWNKVNGAAGYALERSTNPAGIFRRVNASIYSASVTRHMNGDTLVPNSEGMLDFQRYDLFTGKPILHRVGASLINGPFNNTAYYYRVRTLDIFGRAGSPSTVTGAVTAKDTTKPSVPMDLATNTDDINGTVNIRWTQVIKDINGHWERPDSTVSYKVYRFTSSGNPDTNPSVLVASPSALPGQLSKDTTDSDPSLRGAFGNKTWWYRVRSVDIAGNISGWSPAVSAIVKDNVPPTIVKGLAATGFEDRISLKWTMNGEPDMSSYLIYRSLCHLGSWVECARPDSSCLQWVTYDPDPKPEKPRKENVNDATGRVISTGPGKPPKRLPCPCSGPFVFLGEITQDSAGRAKTAGNPFFEDKTIPAGSPLCYAYWIKAKDSSDNQSGEWPLPSAAERLEIVCQRLHDLTAPEPAIISALSAQADQIRIDWMGPPTQDTRAYHVYRAEGTDPRNEPALADYKWVGGMTVELPPTLPKILTSPYSAPALAACDKISVQATPWMTDGYFEDRTIEPKHTYWYRVTGIDYDGNETKLEKAAPISTFSFSGKTGAAPTLDVLAKQADPCAVLLQWSPAFEPLTQIGFIIYRSQSAAGPFLPIVVSPLKGINYIDKSVVHGETYYYRIGLLAKSGRLSELSITQSITP